MYQDISTQVDRSTFEAGKCNESLNIFIQYLRKSRDAFIHLFDYVVNTLVLTCHVP